MSPTSSRVPALLGAVGAVGAVGLLVALAPSCSKPGPTEGAVFVGATATGVPFTFLDVESQSPRGVMVDVIEAIGKDAGMDVEIRMIPFDSLIPSLTTGKIQVISAAMLVTEERGRVIDFSDPVYRYGEGLVVSATDETEYRKLEDLKGEIVGAQVGTIYVDGLRRSGLFSEVRVYDSIADILQDVRLGRLKAGFGDFPILAYQLGQEPDPSLRLVTSYEPRLVGEVGIGVAKGDDELLRRINESLARIKDDGTLSRILAKWGLP